MEITREEAEEIAEGVEGDVYERYSGRAMYGSTCFGITGAFSEVELGISLASVLGIDEAREVGRLARRDSMGRGIVVYFPGVEVEGANDEVDD